MLYFIFQLLTLFSMLKKWIFIGFILLGHFTYAVTLYGHRGARGLAPENTLPGYQVAINEKVDYVDLDVTMTKDGVVIVLHDLMLNPDLTRDSSGQWLQQSVIVKNLTFNQLQQYDVGEINPTSAYAKLFPQQKAVPYTNIPSLRAVIHAVKQQNHKIGFQIELKLDPTHPELSIADDVLIAAVERIIREEHIVAKVQSFDWGALQKLQQLNPLIATAYLSDAEYEKQLQDKNPVVAGEWTGGKLLKNYGSIPKMIKALGGSYWDAQDVTINKKLIQEAHRLGLKVVVWTWPEKTGKDVDVALLRRLIAMGVDGIISDRPDRKLI